MEPDLVNLAHLLIRMATCKLRAETPPVLSAKNKAITTQVRSGNLHGKHINRLIIHLHSTGCGWARQSGGCTMCGFYAATSAGEPISSIEYQEQVADALNKYDSLEFSVLGLFNAGNLLNENEMPFDALEKICMLISQKKYIKKIAIESKLEYIDFNKVKRIAELLPEVEIELGIGVETCNEKVRDLCINKPFSNRVMENKVEILHRTGIIPKSYLLLKPPFLTEQEAIDDFISSYLQLNLIGIERIECETMTIEDRTLVHQLWKNKQYRLPWLWTLINITEQLTSLGKPIYFTPFQYIVNSIAVAHNCEICSDKVKKKIFDYQDGKIGFEALTRENCPCKEEWQAELERNDERPIEARIVDTLADSEIVQDAPLPNFDFI